MRTALKNMTPGLLALMAGAIAFFGIYLRQSRFEFGRIADAIDGRLFWGDVAIALGVMLLVAAWMIRKRLRPGPLMRHALRSA